MANNEIKSVVKPQYVDRLPKIMKGKIGDVLKKADTSDKFDIIVERLGLKNILNKYIEKREISGGE